MKARFHVRAHIFFVSVHDTDGMGHGSEVDLKVDVPGGLKS